MYKVLNSQSSRTRFTGFRCPQQLRDVRNLSSEIPDREQSKTPGSFKGIQQLLKTISRPTTEGLSFATGIPQTFREETVTGVIEKISGGERVLLVKGPPYSGKSTLAELIEMALRQNDARVHRVSCSDSDSVTNWYSFWKTQTGCSWETMIKESDEQDIFVLVDEAQRLYDRPCPLWDVIKDVRGGRRGKKLSIVLFSLFESERANTAVTPFDLPLSARITLQSLLFTGTEHAELIADFNKKNWILPESVSQYIRQVTGGHPGITSTLLRFLREQVNKAETGGPHLAGQLLLKLRSEDFLSTVKTLRGIKGIRAIAGSKEESQVLDKILNSDNGERMAGTEGVIAEKLVMQGYLSADASSQVFNFASPVHRLVYFQERYHEPSSQVHDLPLPELIKRIVVRMKPSALLNSVSVGTDRRPLERLWQMEFYRAATSLLPSKHVISPDAGTTFNLKKDTGYVDFWINDELKYAVELLREGIDMAEHERRFEVGGLYEGIVDQAKGWVIVDFRSAVQEVKKRGSDMIHISYNSDFTKVTFRQGDHTEDIPLQGDTSPLGSLDTIM
eukprot:TRINITY_DN370_c0_g1_i1.p1 TRINITY_DN370_c0_g1~~TRINITY_DN370_c0_g1_i1.p1  ORF type:complete len:561 (+),score=61.51 TRINITY_DN370_c0_g1_i1:80-1762(+)